MADSGGLYLEVMPNGSKLWRFKYRFLKKEKRLALGKYPLVSLAEAREQRDAAKKTLLTVTDPAEIKKEKYRQALVETNNSFKSVALEWMENHKERWTKKYSERVLRRLELDIFPYLGDRPIGKIDTVDVLDVLKKIEKRNALELVARGRQICGQIFKYGRLTRKCTNDPTRDLYGAFKTRKTKHYAAIESREIPELLAAIELNDARLYGRTRRALKLSLLTFLRPGELRQARWEEFNFSKKEWLIPAERMKARADHIVPLSKQAIEILELQKVETGDLNTEYVFPSQKKISMPMSSGTIRIALQNLGFKDRMTAHGFRALARTAIREELHYAPDIIEAQLAHKPAGALGAAYDRAKFIKDRHSMMQKWANYLDRVAAESKNKVVVAKFKKLNR